MRKITQQAINAFMNLDTFKSGNTEVMHGLGRQMELRLHGNCISTISKDTKEITISLAGWNTNTTRERLNGIPAVKVSTKQGQAYLNGVKWDGKWISIDNLIF